MKVISFIVYKVSEALYKLFGVNTPVRKAWLKKEARKIQVQLAHEHSVRDMVNHFTNGAYTTKEAMKIAKEQGWD